MSEHSKAQYEPRIPASIAESRIARAIFVFMLSSSSVSVLSSLAST